ncbi:hypothetical protein [Stakelama saccharophila]|uniref:EF-hand domain-containing protein n=1 Tax=Stakelama saccharophila TaxID=3075605 RepID=A0ABZ0BBI9_9SPHN|nr:hypothetical protein [Stakelama sp. W311]WNO54649.1 hypothetical protein RPR59_05195 [Stakelama sp. W311]
MLKYALLAGAMMISAPASAQNVPAEGQDSPAADTMSQGAPQTPPADPSADTTQSTETGVDTATQGDMSAQDSTGEDGVVQDGTTQDSTGVTTGADTQSQGGTTADQVGAMIDSQFGTYDADGSGDLNAAEFNNWMASLRSTSEPGFDPSAASSQQWMTQAYAQADADHDGGVSKTELTTFLAGSAR